jgi:putative ABC transport system substrate-binding protein
MHRRSFIALVGAAITMARTLRAQGRAMPVVGFLHSGLSGPYAPYVTAFHHGLSEAGYVEDYNVAVGYRWAEGRYDQLPALAGDLVGRKVDVIAASGGSRPARETKRITSTVPIIFVTGADPVRDGLVASLARPEGNATGVTILQVELIPKRLELLSELVPQVRVLALLVNSNYPNIERIIRDALDAASTKNVQLHILKARNDSEIDGAFDTLLQQQVGALVVANDPFLLSRREQLVALAARHATPAIYFEREFAASGGLISYGSNIRDVYRLAGTYVGKILKGAKPADLPVQQPAIFELVINLKTAKALGITVPPLLLAEADEVIE